MTTTASSSDGQTCAPAPAEMPASLTEGIDYYLENGMLVFTGVYHLRRGSCCGNGCRHCPYPVDENR